MRRLLPLLIATGLLIAACGSDDGGGDQAGGDCEVQVNGDPAVKPVVEIPENCDPPTDLRSTDIREGEGATVEAGDNVVVDYTLYTWSARVEIDSSWNAGAPFPVNDVGGPNSGVIEGWNEGLIGMKQSGRRLLIVPPEKAYGAAGSSNSQLAGETLVFVIDLNEVTKGATTGTD